MERDIGLGKLLDLTRRTKNDFDGPKNREVLPRDLMDRYDFADGRTRAMFTAWEVVLFKTFSDLNKMGLNGKDARDWISSATGYIARGWGRSLDGTAGSPRVELAPPRDPMVWQGDDLFICREAYTADFVKDFPESDPEFSVRCWGGTEAEIHSQIAFENSDNANAHRETLSLQLYNLSKAVRAVQSRLACRPSGHLKGHG